MTKLEGTSRKEAIAEWMKLPEVTQHLVMELTEFQEDRAGCCEPYDCMHHEQCGEDDGKGGYWYCGSCKERQRLYAATDGVPALVWSLAREMASEQSQQVIAYQLETIRQLEAVGDFAAAERMMEGA